MTLSFVLIVHKGISVPNGESYILVVIFSSQKNGKEILFEKVQSAVVHFVNNGENFGEISIEIAKKGDKEVVKEVFHVEKVIVTDVDDVANADDVDNVAGVKKDNGKKLVGHLLPAFFLQIESILRAHRALSFLLVLLIRLVHDLSFVRRSAKCRIAKLLDSSKRYYYLSNQLDKGRRFLSSYQNLLYAWEGLELSWFVTIVHVTGLLLCSGDVHPNPGPDVTRMRDTHRNRNDVNNGGMTRDKSPQSKCELQVVSLNVRGLGDTKKVRHLVNACYKLTKAAVNSLFMFQETYVSKLDLLRYLWRGEYKLTMGTGNSLGCITLLTAPYKIIHSVEIGQRGHVLALSKDDPNKIEAVVANAYAPCGFDNDKRLFFEELFDCINDVKTMYSCNKVILAGDLNIVLNNTEVKNRSYPANEKRMADDLKLLIQQADLTDGWARSNSSSYTWTSSRSGQQSFSTLDRILFTSSTLTLQQQSADWSLSVSDHAAVVATYNEVKNSNNNANFIPRLDPRLLLDPEGKDALDETFREMFDQRARDWNPHVRLEYGKMCIRSAANMATSKIKSRYRDEEKILNNDINLVTNELA